MKTLRETQKELTRNMLLDAGLDLFVSQGYAATTIDDIASAAGTTRVTFYAYFPSKVDLMKILISERLNAALDRVRSTDHGSTELELVAVIENGSRERIHAWLDTTSQRWDTIRPYTTAAVAAATVDSDIRAVLNTWLDEAASDVKDGLDCASRFPPKVRHFRSIMAITQLDYVARNWTPGSWNVERDEMIDGLTDGWMGLVGRR